MKKYLITASLALLSTWYACDSEYETWASEDAIYMNETSDTTRFSFTWVEGETQTRDIHIRAIGRVYDYDRTVNLKITPKNAVEGVDFEPLAGQYVIKAGETELIVPVVMIRTEALRTEEKVIDMELLPNEHFTTLYEYGSGDEITWVTSNRLRQTLIFSEFMTQAPSQWNPYMLGPFSQKKFILICEVMGIERGLFLDANYMGYRISYIGKYMKKYLADEKAAGRMVYEEDGVTEMVMGQYAQ